MIKLRDLLMETKHSYGCIMAFIGDADKDKILKFNSKIIPDDVIYNNDDMEFGRELEPHITIKFGFTKKYNRSEIEEFLKDIKPFEVKFDGISIFKNSKFDVIKMDVKSEELNKINKQLSKLPNVDEFPTYHAHCTLAYVEKGRGKDFIKHKCPISSTTINKIVYSNDGKKLHFKL